MRRTYVDDTICGREVDCRKQQDQFRKEHVERTKNGALENSARSPADALALRVHLPVLLRVGLAQALRLLCGGTEAKVAGRKRWPSGVQEPAKTIMTQNTRRRPRELVVMLPR